MGAINTFADEQYKIWICEKAMFAKANEIYEKTGRNCQCVDKSDSHIVNHPGLKPEACGSRPDHTICRHKLPGYSRLAHDAAAVMRGGPPVRGRLSWPAAGQGEIPTGYNSSSARCRTMTAAFTSRS